MKILIKKAADPPRDFFIAWLIRFDKKDRYLFRADTKNAAITGAEQWLIEEHKDYSIELE